MVSGVQNSLAVWKSLDTYLMYVYYQKHLCKFLKNIVNNKTFFTIFKIVSIALNISEVPIKYMSLYFCNLR